MRKKMHTFFCSLNLLNVSDSPATGWAVVRDAINLQGFVEESFKSLNEEEDEKEPRRDGVSKRFWCRKEVDLKAIAIPKSVSFLSNGKFGIE